MTSEQSVHERAMRFLCFRSESQKNQGAELPKQVGDYRLGEPLGHGTSGSVFEAIQLNLQRKVALKLISLPPADWHPSGQERLAREAQLLAAIRHPNLVEVYDSGFQQGYFWISMEFVEGQTLADVLQGKSDSAPKQHGPEWLAFTARILEQLASALAALHADGIIHRDIKPGNILIDEDGEAHLVDFGLAKRDQDPGLTETDQFVGTPRYASPQQARGEKLTPASDLFSLGAVAFEMLNGEVAFGGSTRTEVLEKVQFSDPKWIRRKQIPSDLCAIVEHCLEKKMKDGYGDGVELLRELQRYALGQPVHAHPIRSWQRLGRRIKRQPRRALSLLGIMMLLLVVGLLSEVVRSQQSSLSEFEIQSILDQARQDWHWGTANAFHQGLQPLLEDEENVPAGVHGLLGDYYLSEYHDEKALFHYELELAIQPDSQADQMGKALAAAAFDHSAPDPGQFADPFDVRTIWLAGLMRHVQGDSPHAVELFNSALALAVDSHPLLIARSGSYLRARNYSDALLDVQAAKETRPSNWLIPFRTAVCQRHLGDLPSAYSTLKGAVLKHTLEGELIFQYLSYWLDHIQPSVTEGSTALPAEVLGLPKDSEYSFICRSKWQSYRDNSQEAIAILEQGRLLHPNSFEIKSLLALELFNENRLEEIVPLAEDVLNCPRHGHKLAGLNLLQKSNGIQVDPRVSIEAIQEIVQIQSRLTPSMRKLLRRIQSKKLGKSVMKICEISLNAHPDDIETWILLAQVRLKEGQVAHAHQAITRALAFPPNEMRTLILAGKISLKMNDFDTFEIYSQQMRELNPNNIQARNLRTNSRRLKAKSQASQSTGTKNSLPKPLFGEAEVWTYKFSPDQK